MVTPHIQDQLLSWASTCSRDDRFCFFKAFVSCMKPEEVGKAKGILSRVNRKNMRARLDVVGPKPQRSVVASSPGVDYSQIDVPPTPSTSKILSTGPAAKWWTKWSDEDTVSIDCVFVALKDVKGWRRMKCATVDIVDGRGEALYSEKVYHKTGSFLCNQHTRRVNGFMPQSFDNSRFKSLGKISTELVEILTNKLVIGVALEGVFRSLDLNIGNYDVVELQKHFCEETENEHGIFVVEPMSLSKMFQCTFNRPIYNPEEPHSSAADSVATMQIFQKCKNSILHHLD